MFFADESLLMYTDQILAWYRYIDNVFVIWDGSTETLQHCLSRMNKNLFNLNFTMTHDREHIAFLDVEVFRDNERNLVSNLYRKPTAGNGILHTSSFHPQTLVKYIPYSQYLWTRRNCLDD